MPTARVITIEKRVVPGAAYAVSALVALPNPYVQATGVPFVPGDLGLNRIKSVDSVISANLAAGVNTPVVVPTYLTDGTNDMSAFNVHFIVASTGVELANNADISACNVLVNVHGQ